MSRKTKKYLSYHIKKGQKTTRGYLWSIITNNQRYVVNGSKKQAVEVIYRKINA